MEIQLWKELLDPYEQAVSGLLVKFRNVREEHRGKNLYSPIESVSGRVKTVASILDKMQNKGISFERLEEEVEDIAGIRIICQFVEDIEKVASLIERRTDMEIRSRKDYLPAVKRYANIANVLGLSNYNKVMSVRSLINWIQFMQKEMNIPMTIQEMRTVTPDVYFTSLEKMAENALADACTASNPRVPTKEDIVRIYTRLWSS